MTPQEHQLVDELFDRLAKLEAAPRDSDAERLIMDGARRAPHALYALVQTALVQDEALKRANARIEDLQAQLGGDQPPQQQQGGFLDSMREAVLGRDGGHGSVPTIRPPGTGSVAGGTPGYQAQAEYPPQSPPSGFSPQPSYPGAPPFGSGGSFLGTAASAAAGVIGGGLLLNSIRSMFGHQHGVVGNDPFALGGSGHQASPWGGGAAGSDLARDAGINDIGQGAIGRANQPDDAGWSDAADDGNADDDSFGADDGGLGGDDTYDV
ncbi:MAG TPA: DUF2076 domain-containing protein [Xanthobacteraceae bacterium]|jgi:hypothetical protein